MRKSFALLLAVFMSVTVMSQSLRESVVVVTPTYSEKTQQFLSTFGKHLKSDGFYAAAEVLESYSKGIYGSGFAYHDTISEKMYIITNRHVVDQASEVEIDITFNDNTHKIKNCQVVACDDALDLALILLPENETGNIVPLPLSVEALHDGDNVFTAGYPGLAGKPSWQYGNGIISNASLTLESLVSDSKSRFIQHTAPVDAGSSGSPLLIKTDNSITGHSVIGINTWKANGRENTNLAIPASAIIELIGKSVAQPATNDSINLKERAQGLTAAVKETYKSVIPYVSYGFVSEISASTFYDLIIQSSDNAQTAINESYEQGKPLDGIRIGIADIICQKFVKKDYKFNRIVSIDTEKNTATVEYKSDNKTINTEWELEQGSWRIKGADNMNKTDIEPNGISQSYGFGTSIYANVGFPFNKDYYGMLYNISFKRTVATFLTYELGIGAINAKTTGIEWDYTNPQEPVEVPVTNNHTMADINIGIGGQLPIKCSVIYIVPYVKGLGGLCAGKEIFGINYGINAGLEFAYKFGYQKYVLLNVGYLHRWTSLFDFGSSRESQPFSGITAAIGVSL